MDLDEKRNEAGQRQDYGIRVLLYAPFFASVFEPIAPGTLDLAEAMLRAIWLVPA